MVASVLGLALLLVAVLSASSLKSSVNIRPASMQAKAPESARHDGVSGSGDGSASVDSTTSLAGVSAAAADSLGASSYDFSLSRRDMSRALVSYGGEAARARRALAKLARGEPIRVAFMGGSITIGTGSSKLGETDYVSTVFRWIREAFPHPDHQLVNGAVGGVPSSYFAVCSEWHMPQDPDLIVLETNINDGGREHGDSPIRRAHERLIRKLLNLPSRPAVIELVFFRAYENMHLHFRKGGDDELVALGLFYRLPIISVRSMVWGATPDTAQDPSSLDGQVGLQQLWLKSSGGIDRDHPAEVGHKWLADLVIFYLSEVLFSLQRYPLGPEDEQSAAAPLSTPLYENNWEGAQHTCLMAHMMRDLVVEKEGPWEWRNEGTEQKPKWGYISTQPGSWLVLKINTLASDRLKPGDPLSLWVAYLQSYEHMGKFEAACKAGCSCDPVIVNSHSASERWSQMVQAKMNITAAESCHLKFTVLADTDSGEHKVKLMGVIFSHEQIAVLSEKGLSISFGHGEGGKLAGYT